MKTLSVRLARKRVHQIKYNYNGNKTKQNKKIENKPSEVDVNHLIKSMISVTMGVAAGLLIYQKIMEIKRKDEKR